MTATADISVVIPTRDRWPLLSQTLASALAQHNVSVEVIVIDDGSRDETQSGLAAFPDSRVRNCRNDAPLGVAAARNTGIHLASAPWVAFLDDDDLWAPHKLERQLKAAQKTGAGFAYSAAVFVGDGLEVAEVWPAPDPDGLLAQVLPANPIPAGSSNVIVRTDLVRRLGGFDERLFQIADWDLWIRLADAATAAAVPETLVAYRVHEHNMVLMHRHGTIKEIELLAAKHAQLATREGVQIDCVRFTRWIAWARRRQGRRLAAATAYLRGAARYRNGGNVVRAAAALLGERFVSRSDDSRVAAASNLAGADLDWLDDYRAKDFRRAQ